MIKELIFAQQFCVACVPPWWVPPHQPPICYPPSEATVPCRQSTAAYIVDGCSIPQQLETLTPSGNRNDPVGGRAGLRPTTFGVEQGVVPIASAISTLPCNQHDKCYKTCQSGQSVCDTRFGAELSSVCNSAYPSITLCPWQFPPLNLPAKCPQYLLEAAICGPIANRMRDAVRQFGEGAYRENQERHCACCFP